jgi:chromosome segregation ATPase
VQARELVRQRREAEAEAEQATKALNENLRDLTPQLLREKIERAEASVAAYRSGRDLSTPLPADLDEAKPISERATEAADGAHRVENECQVKLEQAEAALSGVQDEASRRSAQIEFAQQATAAAGQQLQAAREQFSDAALDEKSRHTEKVAADARDAHARKASELDKDDPASVTALLENARNVLERLRSNEQTLKQDLSGIKSELGVRGEAGLHDQLAAVESQLANRAREKTLTDRRAAAVECLYARLAANRDAAKRSYVAPFKQQLDAFARIVFGTTASVEVDHETLQIVSRTLGGATVPYGSLSAGAREQLCVLARLACAALVSPAGDGEMDAGVPVIFDDTLGYSDAGRLERVGAAFNLASRESQVIVLTCAPERYRNIGSATVIHLEESSLNPSTA